MPDSDRFGDFLRINRDGVVEKPNPVAAFKLRRALQQRPDGIVAVQLDYGVPPDCDMPVLVIAAGQPSDSIFRMYGCCEMRIESLRQLCGYFLRESIVGNRVDILLAANLRTSDVAVENHMLAVQDSNSFTGLAVNEITHSHHGNVIQSLELDLLTLG